MFVRKARYDESTYLKFIWGGKFDMPFIKTNVSEQIEFLREKDPDFKKTWDESRTEYRLIGEMISLRTKI